MTSRPTDPSIVRRRSLKLAWPATDGAGSMLKVAFASGDRVRVDQHFGAATGFTIYAVDAERARLAGVADFPEEGMDGNEGKLPARIAALEGCAAVYCLAVGGSAVRQLLAQGIQPLRLDEPESIEHLLAQVRAAIRTRGVAWIDKAMRQEGADDARFDRMAAESWEE